MLKKGDCLVAIKDFRSEHGLEASDENTIATLHIMNAHGLDVHAALDQSSRGSNDHGIDAWYYDDGKQRLVVYQSKLTESKALALRGLQDLDRSREWIEQVIIAGSVEVIPSDNNCLFNLYTLLSRVRKAIKRIEFVLISPFCTNELEDTPEYREFERSLGESKLNRFMWENLGGKLSFEACEYNLEEGLPPYRKTYPIEKIPNTQIDLRKAAHLELAYIPLYSLVELYRQRGAVLFDKNVRLSLMGSKEARERLVTPMDATLDAITSGKLSASIFPFYHIGVTVSASMATNEDASVLNLEAPSIINGCQTITIAHEYLKKLERRADLDAIDRFKKIKVIAKVVVGTTDDELKEITNSNNRQNPIENWQLFSNEPIHVEIESALTDIGVFYERQRGKFDSVMKNSDTAKRYFATNGTYIRVIDLGQLIALSRHQIQWAAKPSEIFLNRENHDKVFDLSVSQYTRDMVFGSNLFRAMKRGLNKYLELPTHANSYAPQIFKKPVVRMHAYHLALLYFYQFSSKWQVRADFSTALNKIASPRLVEELQGFYQKIIAKVKTWYSEESNGLATDVSKRQMDAYFANLANEIGIEVPDGAIPFTATSIDWADY